PPIAAPDAARRVLRGLALALHEGGAVAWTREELRDALGRLRDVDPGHARDLERPGDPDAFLDACAARTGILAPHGGPEAPWKFLHRQFRDVLAAEALRDAGERWTELVGVLDAETIPGWSETLELLCGLVADPRAVLEVLRELRPAAAVRALSEVEGLPPAELLAFLLSVPTEPTEREPT